MNKKHLVPIVVQNIGEMADKRNIYTNRNEKFQAASRLEAIIEYCNEALERSRKVKK